MRVALGEDFGPVRLYDLRGTAATLWASSGLGIFEVSRRLGHSSVAVTEKHYADLWEGSDALDRERELLRRLEEEQERAAEQAAGNVVRFPQVS